MSTVPSRIEASCTRCGLSVSAPARSAIGPAVIKVFQTEHAGHDPEETL